MKYIALCMALLGCSDEEAQKARFAREAEIQEAAEALCAKGTPNAKAGAAVKGKRPIMQVIGREQSGGEMLWFVHPWEGLPKPAKIEELLLVACRVESKSYASSCEYSGGYTIRKYKNTDIIRVLDAKTGQQLAEQRFEGAAPSDNCDESIVNRGGESSREVSGDNPDKAAETAFLKKFVESV